MGVPERKFPAWPEDLDRTLLKHVKAKDVKRLMRANFEIEGEIRRISYEEYESEGSECQSEG